MAQHFLLSAASRTTSLRAIYKAGEDAAYETFCEMRWPETKGEAVCPQCGHDETYKITTRRKFKCKGCAHQFSVTSGTIFASRKMDFVDLLAAIFILVNASKGVSMVQLSRDLDCQYKTAFVLSHKLREAMAQEVQAGEVLEGHVEIDGAYFGVHIRPANAKVDRVDRRLKSTRRARAALLSPCVSVKAACCLSWVRAKGKALHWPMKTCPAQPQCQRTKQATGMRCTWATMLTA